MMLGWVVQAIQMKRVAAVRRREGMSVLEIEALAWFFFFFQNQEDV